MKRKGSVFLGDQKSSMIYFAPAGSEGDLSLTFGETLA